ncbi:hypothetical protein [Pectobacterium parmentieri]|uniref:hypothetical protein n=1 Tax=Pectobacterium parmentieri TaxID=1905730 RepID=UPI0011C3DE30|nr:hypothetical protein [Pectobacterium parmentieri]
MIKNNVIFTRNAAALWGDLRTIAGDPYAEGGDIGILFKIIFSVSQWEYGIWRVTYFFIVILG